MPGRDGVARLRGVLVAAGLAVAIGVPAGWWLTRPAESAGEPVLTAPVATSPAATAPAAGDVVATRSAELAGGTAAAAPERIRIPSLDVDAPVVPAGVDAKSVMEIPEDVGEVGWYRYGPAPGAAAGSTVLAGHVDSAEQGKGALFGLRSVDVGAAVDVKLSDGRTVAYRVTGRETIVKRRLPTERLFVRDGAPRLVLVTCGGPFLPELSSYRDNLVVVAEPA